VSSHFKQRDEAKLTYDSAANILIGVVWHVGTDVSGESPAELHCVGGLWFRLLHSQYLRRYIQRRMVA
jgi:hypothetical protein